MYSVLFETNAEKTVESVNKAFLRETGELDWGYNTIEDIEKAEKDGFLEFKDGTMIVYVDMN